MNNEIKTFYVDIRYEWTGLLEVQATNIENAKQIVEDITFNDPWDEVYLGGHSLWIDNVSDAEEIFWKEPDEGGQSEGDEMMTNGWKD